ncbi:MAG: alanine--tRNA ligase-related protein [Chitinophagales bacterium]
MTNTTKLSYLINPAVYNQVAVVTGKGTDEKGLYFITDVTPAYPQGGGQESDTGVVTCESHELHYNAVRYFEGQVKHYIEIGWEKINVGAHVNIIVDENRRKRNSILHTAGHLIASVAFKNIPQVIPVKGHHFSDGSYIELSGTVKTNLDDVKSHLQYILNEEIQTEKAVSYQMVTLEELKMKCPFVQPGLPEDKPLRVVNIQDFFPMGCGGTHVTRLNEIPVLNITKLKVSKDIIRIGYSCDSN